MKPVFPLCIRTEEGVEEVVNSEEELATSLEWFDSTKSDGSVVITDALGRPVVLRIDAMEITVLEVGEDPGRV